MFSLGPKAKLYRNTGSYGSPVWASLDLVSDLSAKGNWDMAEGTTRSSRGKVYGKTLLDIEVSGKVREDLTDAGYLLLARQLNSDTALDMLVLDGPSTTTGQRGFRAWWHVSADEQDQGLGVVVFDAFTLKPAIPTDGNYPQSVEVVASAPVYTAIGAG